MDVTAISLKGHRNDNEDRHNVILGRNGVNFLSIYDGHGGRFVSSYLHDVLYKYFVNNSVSYPINRKYIRDVFKHVQSDLKNKYPAQAQHTGSTSCVVIEYKKSNVPYLCVINTGDSRCVLCRNNFGIPLTKDHKPAWPEERRRLEELGGVIKFDGDDYRIKDLSVSRAFGDLDAQPFLTQEPDIFKYRLDQSDKFVILACDGLWDVVDNQEAINFVIDIAYDKCGEKRINKHINISKKLADYAIQKGSMDNVSVVIAFLEK